MIDLPQAFKQQLQRDIGIYTPVIGRVLGIDIALYHTGWAVAEKTTGDERLVHYGHWGAPAHKDTMVSWRRAGQLITTHLAEVIQDAQPEVIYLEGHQGVANRKDHAKTAVAALGGARMAAILAVPDYLPMKTVEVQRWRGLLTGHDRAGKDEAQGALRTLGLLPEVDEAHLSDIADAIGVAVIGARLEWMARLAAKR